MSDVLGVLRYRTWGLARLAALHKAYPLLQDSPGQHSCNRLFEWYSGRTLFFFGLWIALFPASIHVARFLNVGDLASLCITVGGVRFVALWLNGNLGIWGPRVRAGLSALTALIWGQFALALIGANAESPSPGVIIYASMFYSEFRTVLRAARDFNGIATEPIRSV